MSTGTNDQNTTPEPAPEPTPGPAYDAVVVGGGTAGLSAALTLARSRRSVLVVDAGQPRNAPATHLHNYLSRDGASPLDLLAAGRAEVTGYGGHVVRGTVTAVSPQQPAGFDVVLADGTSVRARRLVVATGLVDELPDLPGVAERWGRDVLHCPFCHGWEVRDQAIGVLATGPMAAHQAQMFRQLSADVTLFLHTGPELGAQEREQLTARDIAVVAGPVASLDVAGDRLRGVRLATGEAVPCQALVVAPRFTARTDLLTSLGLEATELVIAGHVAGTFVPADHTGATAVPGVWVAGNVTDLMAQLVGAAAAGVRTGGAVHGDLLLEDVAAAVAERRRSPAQVP